MGKDLRCYPRLCCCGPAQLFLAVGEPPFAAKIVDLSVGGCLLVLRKPQDMQLDKLVEVFFNVNQLPFRVRGQIKAVRSATEIGFAFPSLCARTRLNIADLVLELAAEHRTRA